MVLMNDPVPTLPTYGKPASVNAVPVLDNHKSQGPLVSLTKKMFKMGKVMGLKLNSKKNPPPMKRKKKMRIV